MNWLLQFIVPDQSLRLYLDSFPIHWLPNGGYCDPYGRGFHTLAMLTELKRSWR